MPFFLKNKKGLLFIHIPKCGGTTLEKTMVNNGWSMTFYDDGNGDSLNNFYKCSPQHMTYQMLNNIFDMKVLDGKIITLVRDPIQRILSEYKWRVKYHNLIETADVWIHRVLEEWHDNKLMLDNHITPQSHFIENDVKIFKLENGLVPVFSYMSNLLGDQVHYDGAVKMYAADINANVSESTLKKIKHFYHDDFCLFQY